MVAIVFCLSENRSLLFEIKRISEIAKIGVYGIRANCQSPIVIFTSLKKTTTTESQFHDDRHAVMQRSFCLFVRVAVNVVVCELPQTVCGKVSRSGTC